MLFLSCHSFFLVKRILQSFLIYFSAFLSLFFINKILLVPDNSCASFVALFAPIYSLLELVTVPSPVAFLLLIIITLLLSIPSLMWIIYANLFENRTKRINTGKENMQNYE
jgi:hypothetical protein